MALGFDDKAVSGAEDFVDWCDGLGAEGEGGHGLGPAHAVDFGGAGEVQGGEESGSDVSVGSSRGHGDDFLHPGGRREGAGHESRGDKRRGATGHVNADAAEGVEALTGAGTLCVAGGPSATQAFAGKGGDVAVGGLEGAAGGRVESAPSSGQFPQGNADLGAGQFRATEFLGQAKQGRITELLHLGDDIADRLYHRGVGHGTAVERAEDAGIDFVAWSDDAHGLKDGGAWGKSQGVEG